MRLLFKRLKVFYFRHKPYFKVYLSKSTKKALLSAIIAFCSALLSGLQSAQLITAITVTTAILSAVIHFCGELLKNEQDRSQRKSGNRA